MQSESCSDILSRCGIEMFSDKAPVLHTSTALFRYKLSEAIQQDAQVSQVVGDCIEDLLASDSITLYLDPVTQPQEDQVRGVYGQPESLVRLLLGVDSLQSRLIGLLLDKFPEFIGTEDRQAAGETKTSIKVLRQLRWLDYIVDSAELTEKLLETLGFVPAEMQSEIVSALPDIISDSDNAEVSKVLAGMLSDTPELMLPLLETLGSLDCGPALLQDARSSVIGHLISAEPLDLPVMIKFLLHSVASDGAASLISRIRRRLDLDCIVLASKGGGKGVAASANHSPDVLIFDVIATSLRSHKHLRDAWLRVIAEDAEKVGTHTTLDLVALLILHQIPAHTRRVETLLRAKIDSTVSGRVAYTPALFEAIIARFPAVFSAHFPALLAVGSWLVRTSALGSQGSRVAAGILAAAFACMGMYQRQEIAGELAVHIGSGSANEIDTAARIFLRLAQQNPRELRPFAVFIKGLLDYVDNLPLEHVRVIFDSLGILSTLGQDGASDSIFSDLYIFVRKQLASVYPKYNRIGIVGTVSLLRQLGAPEHTVADSATAGSSAQAASAAPVNLQALRRAVQLLEMLMDSARHQSWAFVSMTYDELAHIVETRGLHAQLLTWLHENVSSTFATHFLADPDLLMERYGLQSPPVLALWLDEEEPTVLDILNHNGDALRLDSDKAEQGVPRLRGCLLSCLPSLLRLIQVCEKALGDGSLGEIDALLVCGLYILPPISPTGTHRPDAASDDCSAMVAGSTLADPTDQRSDLIVHANTWTAELQLTLCSSLYVAVNWVRELINAFADQHSAEILAHVARRANQLPHIEASLMAMATSLAGSPHEFRPMASGLVAELSDAPSMRAVDGASLRLSRPELIGAQGSNLADHTHTMDLGGLLLSQDDTRKLIDGTQPLLLSPSGVDSVAAKRGRSKRKFGAFAATGTAHAGAASAGASDDFCKSPHVYLRELGFSAFRVLLIGSSDLDAPGALLSAPALALVVRELGSILGVKLVRHTENRSGFSVRAPTHCNLATFSSNTSASSATQIVAGLLPLLPALLRYLAGCLAASAQHRDNIQLGAALDAANAHRQIILDDDGNLDQIDQCIDGLLGVVSSVLHWDGLQSGAAETTAILGVLAAQGGHTDMAELNDLEPNTLVRRAFDYLWSLTSLMPTAQHSTILLRILIAARTLSTHEPTAAAEEASCLSESERDESMDGCISRLAQNILNHSDHGVKPVDLEYMIAQHILRYPHNRLDLIHRYATETLPGFVSGQPTEITQATFPTYYKAVLHSLGQTIKTTLWSQSSALLYANRVAESWLSLNKLTQQQLDLQLQRTILHLALKSGHTLIDHIIKLIMPTMDSLFLLHSESILAIFSRIQKSTRILQNICNHSKVAKDTKLQQVVPQIKRRLEQMVFLVVAFMENNCCREAVNLGNLKHRDIRGQVVSSQIPRMEGSSEDEEMEEEAEMAGITEMAGMARMAEIMDVDRRETEIRPIKRYRTSDNIAGSAVGAGKKQANLVNRKKQLIQRRDQRAMAMSKRKTRHRNNTHDAEEEDEEEEEE
ncbi:Fanconi anemia group D2 protein [Kickxella alabastrina]|uniref:Fanconi anemia group D2 protein n=1 Tax=Kickxella alabastrina TaxID=61397 RepID=A0ACC1ITB2_9FUNG|nr:Fanconi anemia group D2 protein [Kickxella alabastrina]